MDKVSVRLIDFLPSELGPRSIAAGPAVSVSGRRSGKSTGSDAAIDAALHGPIDHSLWSIVSPPAIVSNALSVSGYPVLTRLQEMKGHIKNQK